MARSAVAAGGTLDALRTGVTVKTSGAGRAGRAGMNRDLENIVETQMNVFEHRCRLSHSSR